MSTCHQGSIASMTTPDMTVSPEERTLFLKRQGWTEQLPLVEREAIESDWDDARIRMAIDLNLA